MAGHGAAVARLPFDLRKFLPSRLTILSGRMARRVAGICERFNVSAPEWRVIAILGQEGNLGSRTMIEMSAMDKVRVSRAVAKLVKAGLITRDLDPRDRRHAVLGLTAEGREIYRQLVPLVQDVEAQIIGELSGAECAMLENALAKVESYLDDGREPAKNRDRDAAD